MGSAETERMTVEVERSRERLGNDIDLLVEKVSPTAIAERRVNAVTSRFGRMKDRVLGSAPNPGEVVEGSQRQVGAHPVALGLVAFGAGWLISTMLPVSEAEKRVAEQAMDVVERTGVAEDVKESARSLGESMKEPVQRSVESVKESATDAVADVRDRTVDITQR